MTYITAHSGSDGTPDNIIEFARYFKDKSIDMVEVDVKKQTKPAGVKSWWIRRQQVYLTLRDFFQEIKDANIRINCHLKENNLEEDIYRLAKEIHLWDYICFSGYVSEDTLKKWTDRSFMNMENAFDKNIAVDEFTEEVVISTLEKLAEKCAKYINIYYQFVKDKFDEISRKLNIQISVLDD